MRPLGVLDDAASRNVNKVKKTSMNVNANTRKVNANRVHFIIDRMVVKIKKIVNTVICVL